MATKLVINNGAIGKLLKSDEVAKMITEKTHQVVAKLPQGYAGRGQDYEWVASVMVRNRAVGVVRANNVHTYNKCKKDHVLENAIKGTII